MGDPARSVIVPGMIRQRPPTTARDPLDGIHIGHHISLQPPATRVRPTREVTDEDHHLDHVCVNDSISRG